MAGRLLGTEWTGVGPLMLVLLPFLISQFSVAQLAQTLNAAGRNGEQFAWDLVRLILVGAAFAPLFTGGALGTAVVAFSCVGVVVYGSHVLLSRRALRAVAAQAASRSLSARSSSTRSSTTRSSTTEWNEREHIHV
jgi:O-antigen/teichoic acid export membrane protein